jgi:hypothetical protein
MEKKTRKNNAHLSWFLEALLVWQADSKLKR